MATACDNIPCDTDLENLLIKINSFLTTLETVEELCRSSKAACDNRVKTLEDEIDGLDEKIDTEIQTLKDFLIAELKKISDCACGLKTDVEGAAGDISKIIQKLKDSNSIVVKDGVVTGWNNIWDPSTSGDFVITGDQIKDGTITGVDIKDGSITGDKIAPGSITPDKLTKSELVQMGSFPVGGNTTVVLSLADPITVANTGLVCSYTLNNTSSVDMQTMFILSGRSGAVNVSDVDQLQTFGVFIDGALIFNYGWTPTMQDSKNANFFYTVPAKGSITIEIRTAKTSADGDTTFTGSVGYIGIKN